jgi:hypothetical protein
MSNYMNFGQNSNIQPDILQGVGANPNASLFADIPSGSQLDKGGKIVGTGAVDNFNMGGIGAGGASGMNFGLLNLGLGMMNKEQPQKLDYAPVFRANLGKTNFAELSPYQFKR